MIIDNQTRRRTTKTGLIANDPAQACPGYLLYAPLDSPGDVYLVNQEGVEVHQWSLPYQPGLYGYILPNGNLFYGGKIRDDTWDRFQSWKRFKGGVILEVDWLGNVVWEHRDKDHHHDARRTNSGGALYLTVEPISDNRISRVQGGVPGTDDHGMWADVIVEVDSTGNRVWEWHAAEHLDPLVDIITFNDLRDEWSHGNTVVPLDDNRVMFSFRNLSTVGIIDKTTGNIVWKIGYETLAQQHDPSMLPNGNILIFDNGSHRQKIAMPSSRVIEVNPNTKQIVWQYQDSPPFNFFSPYISGARRLANGNTLITEGNFGRMFQVTPQSEVVWEYINPYFHENVEGMMINSVFRSTHYTADQLPNL